MEESNNLTANNNKLNTGSTQTKSPPAPNKRWKPKRYCLLAKKVKEIKRIIENRGSSTEYVS